jgi:DNA-directed RNA polymerase specialized sigma subunit
VRQLDDTDLDGLAAQVRSFPPLPLDEVRALLGQAHAEGPGPAQRRLVEHHLNIALAEALARGDKGVEVTDLYQEATVATMVAVSEYAARAGRPEGLGGYVAKVVARHLDYAIESETGQAAAERAFVRDVEAYEAVEVRLRRDLGRAPTPAEIGAVLPWTEERIVLIGEMLNDARVMYDSDIVGYLDDN